MGRKFTSKEKRNSRLLNMQNLVGMKSCIETAQFLKEERKRKKISIAELSNNTKISVSVIEALENAWISQFPEKAYLPTMLRILEVELGLEINSLNKLIPITSNLKRRKKQSLFQFGNIISSRLFSTLSYTIFMLTSILLLNKYHLMLLESHVKTVNPVNIKNVNENNIDNVIQ